MTTAYAELIERLRSAAKRAPMNGRDGVVDGAPEMERVAALTRGECTEIADALAALTRELEEARATAFEEAAKIGDGHRDAGGGYVAFAIRQHANGLSRTSAVRQADTRPLHEHDGEHDEH